MPELTDELRTILEQGEIEVQGQFMLGSNYTFLVNVNHGGQTRPAVYKPSRGEQPLWDFPEASLAGREVAAYLVSEALGFHFIPYTILRDGPFGPGSLQQFIDYNPNYHYFNFKTDDRLRLRPVALFDLLINNADRKGGHILVEKRTRRLFVIDHGLCFHEDDKLRTILWDFAGEAIPPDLLAAVDGFHRELSGTSGLRPALAAHLTRRELAALSDRAARLVAEARFPHPPMDRRAYPYPPL
jgi:hypothetical protein